MKHREIESSASLANPNGAIATDHSELFISWKLVSVVRAQWIPLPNESGIHSRRLRAPRDKARVERLYRILHAERSEKMEGHN